MSRAIQFRLRTLFAFVAVLCVIGAWAQNRASRQQRAVAALERVGAGVYYDWLFHGAEYPGPGVWQVFVRHPCFRSVRSVNFPYTSVGDEQGSKRIYYHLDAMALAALRQFPRIRYVGLENTDITTTELARLRNDLPHCKIDYGR